MLKEFQEYFEEMRQKYSRDGKTACLSVSTEIVIVHIHVW